MDRDETSVNIRDVCKLKFVHSLLQCLLLFSCFISAAECWCLFEFLSGAEAYEKYSEF